MFETGTYIQRREQLRQQLESGAVLFLGNHESPMNYPDNPYPFRQDSSFLYYWGLDAPGLAALLDVESGEAIIYGAELTLDDIIWMGPQPSLAERAERVGVTSTRPAERLVEDLGRMRKQGRRVHYLPPYRADNRLLLAQLFGVDVNRVNDGVSESLLTAVIAQRSVKSDEEIAQIEQALEATREMHLLAMRQARPGVVEREIVGKMTGVAISRGGQLSFPIIFSRNGETLHNHYYGNTLQAGDLVVCDAGAESAWHYAGDITRTIPVGGRFTERQKAVYEIVLRAQQEAIAAVNPETPFRDVHVLASRRLAEGLVALGLLKGEPEAIVAAGAHALFFPHGLGHMLGLDVHDMESLGEDRVGYDAETRRSGQFGLRALRFAKRPRPGYVLTVEPGLYFIPALVEKWKREGRFPEFIDYQKVETYLDFGGIRIEDNVVVTESGCRVLGSPIPKSIEEVEAQASE